LTAGYNTPSRGNLFKNTLLKNNALLFGTVRGTGELVFELFDASRRVHELQFARVEGMADAANIDFEFRFGRPGRKFVAATAGYLGLNVFWMDVTFHVLFSQKSTTFIVPEWGKM